MTERVFVSFSGVDGSGKSTQIEALVRELSREHSTEVLWSPLTLWPQSLLSRLPAGMRARLGHGQSRRSGRRSSPAVGGPGEQKDPPPATWMSKVFWFCVGSLAAVSSAVSLRHRLDAAESEVVILDRFRLDTIVKLQYWYSNIPSRWLTRIVLALAPAPTLELLLHVPAQDAYTRKSEEWSVDQLTRHSQLYDDAARAARAVVLDGRQDVQTLTKTVRAQIQAVLDGRG